MDLIWRRSAQAHLRAHDTAFTRRCINRVSSHMGVSVYGTCTQVSSEMPQCISTGKDRRWMASSCSRTCCRNGSPFMQNTSLLVSLMRTFSEASRPTSMQASCNNPVPSQSMAQLGNIQLAGLVNRVLHSSLLLRVMSRAA